ncbi:MAG TPA: hypothetical protein ENN65_00150, partial [Candidatus Hydrogenedentes bacterium]|nr:hypothetical protein [Candidatus Hydrogenedentota bacterium]
MRPKYFCFFFAFSFDFLVFPLGRGIVFASRLHRRYIDGRTKEAHAMSIKNAVQEALKQAMKNKNTVRLECLRLAKAALLIKEKEGPKEAELSDEDAVKALRAEVRKRQQSIETYREVNRPEEVTRLEAEIAVLEEFLPKQLAPEAVEQAIRAYLAE